MPIDAPTNTPLAPSVEKAYYRKCIQLKRRLNEVAAANDDAKLRRLRIDRSIMKMRLERAFLLDELRKRMDHNVDASDGSGDEGMQTPPADRPYRDKRRRALHSAQAQDSTTFQSTAAALGASASNDKAASAADDEGRHTYSQRESLAQGTPQGPPPIGTPSAGTNGTDAVLKQEERTAAATGEPTADS